MGDCTILPAARWLCAVFVGLAATFSLSLSAGAQDTALMTRGDAAVTAFSGARQLGEVPADLHPLDLTFIDVNGATLQVFDLTTLGGPPEGQVANAPIKFQATAGEIGQVFGVTLDGDDANATPNIYVTATSLFGLQIVTPDGDRLVKGELGARWMPGQFGKGGTPSSVWKIDGSTGVISLLANIKQDGKDNAGPGLGDIAYDPASKQLFVTDLETGLIHRLGLDGSDRGTFDHGTAGRPKDELEPVAYDAAQRMGIESPKFDIENPASWGFADKRRAVFAVAVHDQRVYYSTAEGPQIWSVGLNDDGSFADDARFEFAVADTPSDNIVTDIVFDGAGTVYLAQRGEIVGSYDYSVFAKPEAADVLRYVWDEREERWSEQPDEYAIGLKDPHRSTEGGIALNYGYDADGNINYNQCRATLWTTGEHLREGEGDRVYEGGARIIHGLQGNDKGAVRPANVPPYDSWFVDNDGLFLDADVYGHVGDIAIFNPCDKRTAAEPEPLPFPEEPGEESFPPDEEADLSEPGIYIDKECYPGIFGDEIHCEITLTNVGETPSDPIDLYDAATLISGPGAGGAVIVTGVTPDGPDWFCSPTPTPDLWCSLPADALDPGETRSIQVFLDTGPLFAAGNFGFLNCAELGAPWYDTACDEGGTDISVTKTAPAACLPGADCTFTVTVTNGGAFPFSGDVQFTDAMFLPDGTALLPPITGIVPALGCGPAPGGLAFSCTAALTLAPGESKAFDITVTMPPAPPAYWAQNCFALSAPGAVPPALPLAPSAHHNMVSCAWVPVGGPPPLTNLRLEKTALHGGACYKVGAATIACDYEIEIFNDGPSPHLGAISFTDDIPAAATLSVIPAPWVCLGAHPTTCGAAIAVPIPVGGSITVPVTATIPLAPLEAAGCGMPNTATLTVPGGGTPWNFFAGDDSDTAIADAFMFWELPDGTTIVTCDPTNLKTTKIAKGDCVASDGGYRCEYVVKVTNLGPDPYKGPIKISEQLGFAPNAVTFSAPWGCPGGGANYQCTHPIVELQKGESVEMAVTATVPDGPHCKLKNAAVMTFPTAGTRFNGDASDDAASATGNIPSKSCVKPDRPQCKPGKNELRSESGACVCKSGFIRDEKGQCVGLTEPPVTEPKLCPDGKPVPKSGHCPKTPPQCEPGKNEVRTDQGQCICAKGFERDKSGRCVKPQSPEDECEDKGLVWSEKTESCVRPIDPADECERKGWEWDGKRCVPPTNPEDECEDRGWIWNDRTDRCLPPPNPEQECEDKGWVWNDHAHRCVPPINPGEECRKRGWTWDGKRCLTPADLCKAKGWTWDDGRCLPPTNPGDECKKKGWDWNGKTKTCSPPSNPADECKKSGGSWNGETCLSPADLCKAKGWNWDHGRCSQPTNPADECRKKGWDWNGKTCQPKPDPGEQCRSKGGVWDGKRCKSPADECKAKGWNWDGKTCQPKPNPGEECRNKGWDWNGKTKTCQPPKANPGDKCKENGGIWNGRTCLNPADICKAKGGKWDGKTCQPKSNPGDKCKENGGIWNGRTCLNPADICKAKGGKWDGKTCQPKSNPGEECRKNGGIWNGKTKTCSPPGESSVPR